MLSSFLTTLLGGSALLSSVVSSSPMPLPLETRDTAELYIFANCINNHTGASYADIFWYYPDFLPDFPEPQLTASVNAHHAIEWAGKKVDVTTPFDLLAHIPVSAKKGAVGTLVANATASSFAGPMAVFKGTGELFYTPAKDVNCYEEYFQQDNQPINDF